MNRLLHLLFPVALGLASGAAADLVASLDAGGNKWGYAAPHAATVQPWDGSPFTLEAELLRPAPGPSGLLPRESWFGLFIEDGSNGSRFSFGPFNPERDANPARVPLAAVCYEKRGHFQVKRSSEQWDTAAERLFLKAEYDGETLRFSASTDGQACREALRIVPAKPFMPNRIGLTLDGFHDRSAIRELRVKEFRVSGSGPARSDRFDGSRQAGWNSTEPKRARFLHPVELELEWRNPPSGNNVFDRGREAAFTLELRTTQCIGETVGLRFRCFDRDGRELWNSSERRTLTAEPLRLSGSVPAERLARNGVYRLRAEAALPGKPAQIREQQFAVIPVIPVTPDRYDRRSPYSGNYFADWNLAARLGIRQIRQTWRQPGEFETRQSAERARANGLLVNGPCLDAAFRPQTPQTLAAKADRIAAAFLELEKMYPDFIYCQEIYNEPENWPPTAVETDLVPFAALVARVRQNLRTAGSKLRLMSPGTTHVNLSFLKTLALVGGRDVVDIVAVHGYRSPNRPEFGHEEDIAAIRDLFGDKPVYVNEDAYFALTAEKPEGPTSITQPFHTMIELDELTHAIYLQRKYLCQFMAGYALVNQFDSIRNHSLSEHEFHRRPGLVTLAALAATLPHPEFVRRRTASTDHLWILDWTTDGRPVTTLWSLNDFHEVTLTAPEPLRVLDAFGNETANGRKVALTVGGAPLFVLGGPVAVEKRAVTARHPAIVLPEEEPLGEKPFAMEVFGRAESLTKSVISVTLRNNSGAPFAGTATPHFMNDAPASWRFTPASQPVKLAPGETVTLEFTPGSGDPAEPFDPYRPVADKGYNALWWTEGYRIAVELSTSAGNAALLHSRRPLCLRGIPFDDRISIDGDLADWNDIPEFPQVGGDRKRNTALARFWTGAADYRPIFKFAWNREGLLFAAEVLDDKHDADCKGLDAWRTDSIQLGLNADHERPDFTGYPVLTLADGSPAILQRATKERPAGPLPEVPLKVIRHQGGYDRPGRTVYECLIPWRLLKFDPESGKPFGFCVQFNESDGWWRKGWEGYFLQMGGHIIDPRRFGDLTPLKPDHRPMERHNPCK